MKHQTEREWLGYPKRQTWHGVLWLLIMVAICLICATASAQVYEVRTTGGQGSAVYVGNNTFVSAKHVFPLNGNGSVFDGGAWHQIYSVERDPNNDLAAFVVDGDAGTRFIPTGLIQDIPDGVDATLCGFSSRREFCLPVTVFGSLLRNRNNEHSLPGDSGGGVFVQTRGRKCLAGVHFGYSCVESGRCETMFVPSDQICQFLTQRYGDCPSCVPFATPQPIARPTPQPRPIQQPRPAPASVAGGCTVVVDYDKLAALFYERYGQQLKGQDGRNGANGDSPQLDLDKLAALITSDPVYSERIRGQSGQRGNDGQSAAVDYQQLATVFFQQYGDQLRGRDGTNGVDGEQGPRGLIGVPDDEDIRNWLVGASSDPQMRATLAATFADIVATDPRVTQLIQRLEALEQRSGATISNGTIQEIERRLLAVEQPRRFMLVDGSTKTVIDDETYKPGEPFVLDVQKILRNEKQ